MIPQDEVSENDNLEALLGPRLTNATGIWSEDAGGADRITRRQLRRLSPRRPL